MDIANPQNLFFTSQLQIDKIIMVKSGSFGVPAPTGGLGDLTREATASFDTGINDYTFFLGIFSLDGGATWNDFNATVVEFYAGNPIFQTCDVHGESYSGRFTIRALNWYNFNSGTGTARTVMWKVAIIAKGDQGNVEGAKSNDILQFSSAYNYQKIFMDDVRTLTLASNERKSTTINHGLGKVPNMRGFIQDPTLVAPLNVALLDTGNTSSLDSYSNIAMDANNITWTVSNENNPSGKTVTLYTRIYVDA
jgi:hypothetical protein